MLAIPDKKRKFGFETKLKITFFDKLSFAKKLLKIRQNTNDRLILVFPQKRVKHFNHDIYERLTNKDFFEMNWDEENWHESPFFMIKPPSYEEWLNEIQYRMTADPQINNAVLLVDDYKYSGHTINTTENDLVKL